MKLFSDRLPFYRACFHCHTTNSDGRLTPKEVVDFYQSAGYQILAITDHRSVTEIRSDEILMISGLEIDYVLPGQWVHILGLGMDKSVAAQWDREKGVQEGINLIRRLGGVSVLAHPAWSLNTPGFMKTLSGLVGVEIWNSVSTLPINGDRADSSSLLDVTWASGGELLPVFANDDSHQYRTEAGFASTMVQAEELTVSSVLDALKAGRFYATTGPEIYQMEFRDQGEIVLHCSPAEAVIFYSDCPWSAGRVHIASGMTECRYAVQPKDRFVRAEIRDHNGKKAWTSPIRVR